MRNLTSSEYFPRRCCSASPCAGAPSDAVAAATTTRPRRQRRARRRTAPRGTAGGSGGHAAARGAAGGAAGAAGGAAGTRRGGQRRRGRRRRGGAAGGGQAAPAAARPARPVRTARRGRRRGASRAASRARRRTGPAVQFLNKCTGTTCFPFNNAQRVTQLGRRDAHAALSGGERPCDASRNYWSPLCWRRARALPSLSRRERPRRAACGRRRRGGSLRAGACREPAPRSRSAGGGYNPAPAEDEAQRARQAELEARVRTLATRLDAAVARSAPPPAAAASASSAAVRRGRRGGDPRGEGGDAGVSVLPRPGFLLSGYAQGQFFSSADSQDQLQQGGAFLNQDQFVVPPGAAARRPALALRRAGARDRRQHHARARRSACGARRPRCSGIATATATPLVMLTRRACSTCRSATSCPPRRARASSWSGRSSSTALFPGAGRRRRAPGGRVAVPALRGRRSSTASRSTRARRGRSAAIPTRAKDIVGASGRRRGARDRAARSRAASRSCAARASTRAPTPPRAAPSGSTPTRTALIDLGEVVAVSGAAATPSANFRRWAVGADLRLALRTPLGLTRLSGEVMLASNLDRGLFVADPVADRPRRARARLLRRARPGPHAWGSSASASTSTTRNADAFDSRAGQLLPASQTITTCRRWSASVPASARGSSSSTTASSTSWRATARGVPTDLTNDRLTARLQVDL